jgi:hypothetical protein
MSANRHGRLRQRGGKEKELMGRAHGSAREEATRSEGAKQKEKCILVRAPTDTG